MFRSSALSLVALAVLWPAMGCPETAQEAMHHDQAPAHPSTTLTVEAGQHTVTLSLGDLRAMPQTTLEVFNAHSKQKETYSGPLLADVLAKADVTLSEATQHRILDSYIAASGTDGYFVVYSGAEVEPGLSKSKVVVAIAETGQPLNRTGAFQLVSSEDVKPARWVRNLSRLSVTEVAAEHTSAAQ